ncbi:grsT [Symbiodinium natans]|uniref:GrsT protein n=1 Tax=Symbiodinium natans TaxID=878477 RepID=A0A812JD45_9DINO|nr:grsT [Symbiodinium natans]
MANQGKYGEWIAAAPSPPSAPKLRIFCVAPVGMSGACFHPWAPGLPAALELMPLELPGRGFRMGEKLQATSLSALAGAALDGIGRPLFEEVPFVVFGHSFGAWLAYELAQQLRHRGWPEPLKLYVSANRAPQLHGVSHDPDGVQPELGRLGEDGFWRHFERRYGANPDLQEDYIRGFIRPVLQGDFSLLESYVPSSLDKLSVPVCALCAKGDNRCRPEQLSAWSEVAGGVFEERWFEEARKPGSWATEHRYIVDNPGALLRFLSADLPVIGSPVDGYTGIPGPLSPSPKEEESRSPEPTSGGRCCVS